MATTHLIFGTGLIGGFIGGGLLHAKQNTVFLGRKKQREELRNGLTISAHPGQMAKLNSPTFLDTNKKTPFDIIWLTVKCTAVSPSLKQLKQLVSPKTIIICCQNGLGSEQLVKDALPTHIVLNAVVGFNVSEHNPNHLHRSTDGHLVIEEHPSLKQLALDLNGPILPTRTSHIIMAERWAKLQLNLANPVNALADIPTKVMVEDRDFRKVIAALMRELLCVTKAMSLHLPKLTTLPAKALPCILGLPNFIYLPLSQKTLAIDPTARASMWWDLSQGKPTEILYLNQSVVEQGHRLGIDCPFNRSIVTLIHEVENNTRKIGINGVEMQHLLGIS